MGVRRLLGCRADAQVVEEAFDVRGWAIMYQNDAANAASLRHVSYVDGELVPLIDVYGAACAQRACVGGNAMLILRSCSGEPRAILEYQVDSDVRRWIAQ